MAGPWALVNASVHTMRTPRERVEALLIEGGKISAAGDERAILRKRPTKVIDLGGRIVLPGLIDSHTHLVHQGLLGRRVDLSGAPSKEAALARVRKAAKQHRQGPLLAERWDESAWPRREWPTKDELDTLTTRFPLVLRRVDGHVAIANTAAIDALEGRLEGVDREKGWLIEDASLNLNRVWPTPVPEAVQALEAAQRLALERGVTTVHDFVTPHYLRAYQTLHRKGRLRIRARLSLYAENLEDLVRSGIERDLGDDRLAIHGVKSFADGSLGGHTASLREPYADQPHNHGKKTLTPTQAQTLANAATQAGLVPSIHAIGDSAIDDVLAAFHALSPAARRLRPRIEHFELHHPEHVARVVADGVIASMQPNFVGEWSRKGGLYQQRLGLRRYNRNNQFAKLLKAGVALAFGSDGMPFDPWFGLSSAANAPHPAQRLTPQDALHVYTSGSAYGLGLDPHLGTLERGKTADFILLRSRTLNRRDLARTHVVLTAVGGRVEHGDWPR